MNITTLNRAKFIERRIHEIDSHLDYLPEHHDVYGLPEDVFEQIMQKITDTLQAERVALDDEFVSL